MSNGRKKFWVKDHGLVLAACDREIIGKTMEGVTISEEFYKGKLVGEKELENKLKKANNINLFGEKTIKIAIRLKIADEGSCIMIGNVPHLNVVSI